ncbi:MAG: putative toxin-antitoxin system toxin component, PIN family [Candidatus Cloacimonadales bacterium]|nr:putative toxin-antitoxin system toxin component, PIN family [Candidatus Cloacimonadales bacterium]
MKILFDTNVLVAAFATRGICNSLFEHTLENCDIVISEFILDELKRTLIEKFKIAEDKTIEIINFLKSSCEISEHKEFENQISRDPNDDPILGIIDKTNIDFLVTGDNDLLILKTYKNIPIISPRELWEEFRKLKIEV